MFKEEESERHPNSKDWVAEIERVSADYERRIRDLESENEGLRRKL